MFIMLGIGLILVAAIIYGIATAAREVTISEFVNKVNAGEVVEVRVNNDVTEFIDKEGKRYEVIIHYNVEEIVIVGADGE